MTADGIQETLRGRRVAADLRGTDTEGRTVTHRRGEEKYPAIQKEASKNPVDARSRLEDWTDPDV